MNIKKIILILIVLFIYCFNNRLFSASCTTSINGDCSLNTSFSNKSMPINNENAIIRLEGNGNLDGIISADGTSLKIGGIIEARKNYDNQYT